MFIRFFFSRFRLKGGFEKVVRSDDDSSAAAAAASVSMVNARATLSPGPYTKAVLEVVIVFTPSWPVAPASIGRNRPTDSNTIFHYIRVCRYVIILLRCDVYIYTYIYALTYIHYIVNTFSGNWIWLGRRTSSVKFKTSRDVHVNHRLSTFFTVETPKIDQVTHPTRPLETILNLILSVLSVTKYYHYNSRIHNDRLSDKVWSEAVKIIKYVKSRLVSTSGVHCLPRHLKILAGLLSYKSNKSLLRLYWCHVVVARKSFNTRFWFAEFIPFASSYLCEKKLLSRGGINNCEYRNRSFVLEYNLLLRV